MKWLMGLSMAMNSMQTCTAVINYPLYTTTLQRNIYTARQLQHTHSVCLCVAFLPSWGLSVRVRMLPISRCDSVMKWGLVSTTEPLCFSIIKHFMSVNVSITSEFWRTENWNGHWVLLKMAGCWKHLTVKMKSSKAVLLNTESVFV